VSGLANVEEDRFKEVKKLYVDDMKTLVGKLNSLSSGLTNGKIMRMLEANPDKVISKFITPEREYWQTRIRSIDWLLEDSPNLGVLEGLGVEVIQGSEKVLIFLLLEMLARYQAKVRSELKSAVKALKEGDKRRLDELYKELDSARTLRPDEEAFLDILMKKFRQGLENAGKKGS
jgi:hypothetical protein